MESVNFEILRDRWPELEKMGGFAEQYIYTDPSSALIKLRVFCEQIVGIIYDHYKLPTGDERDDLYSLTSAKVFKNIVPEGIVEKIHLLRQYGNEAAHKLKLSDKFEPLDCLAEAWSIGCWLYVAVGNGAPEEIKRFQPSFPTNHGPLQERSLLNELEEQKRIINDLHRKIRNLQKEESVFKRTERDTIEIKNKNQSVADNLNLLSQSTQERLKDIQQSRAGFFSNLREFFQTDQNVILDQLKSYVDMAEASQIKAWQDSINILQDAVKKVVREHPDTAAECSVIMEYTIPLESRRIDAVLLMKGAVLVIEFKGAVEPTQAGIAQAAAYSRDLRAYHKECSNTLVKTLLVLTKSNPDREEEHKNSVTIVGSHGLSQKILEYSIKNVECLRLDTFLELECYRPLPSLIKAARELFTSKKLTRIHRAAAATEPALKACADIISRSSKEKRRSLILINGVPGAGKTLVGLQLAHAGYLEKMSVAGSNAESHAPAVFLSGNGPLVEVLQYEMRSAGGDGKTFVRGVHEYVKTFTSSSDASIPHHVLIYDEAQRAFDAAQVQAKHRRMPQQFKGMSEPELFVRFAERVPEWSVIVGLIGTGQEIHIGEEGGIGQWRDGIENAQKTSDWDIFMSENESLTPSFQGMRDVNYVPSLELTTTIRYHLAVHLHDFVEHILDGRVAEARDMSDILRENGYELMMTHKLEKAKEYLVLRYADDRDARYGMLASSRDNDLRQYGIPMGYRSPGEVSPGQYGRWYAEPRGEEGSCSNLDTVATEFGAQGLELDATLLAWGTDFLPCEGGQWSNYYAKKYGEMKRIKDPLFLRKNAYRVLLTRGRDALVVFVPPIPDRTRELYRYLRACGFVEIN